MSLFLLLFLFNFIINKDKIMTDFKTNWTREEFKAYLMMHCANADYVETEDEKELILSKISRDTYKHIHKEFNLDNDYTRLQKIILAAERFDYTQEKADVLLQRMKKLFLEDHDMSIIEDNMFRGLKRLLA